MTSAMMVTVSDQGGSPMALTAHENEIVRELEDAGFVICPVVEEYDAAEDAIIMHVLVPVPDDSGVREDYDLDD